MIISVTTLSEIRKKYRKHRIVFAGGVFDVFHIAHIKTLRKLRAYGDIVVIGVVSDKRVRERKGPNRPIILQKDRREIVDAIKYVDFVVQMPNPNRTYPRPTIIILKKLRPDIFVTVDRNWIPYRGKVEDMGIKLKIVKRIHTASTTATIEKVLSNYRNK